ncbi:MAG: type IV secretion system protein [Pseudomonadota bacterium]|nr:type IV secretion system protein [Pseudomonadota bacterium]
MNAETGMSSGFEPKPDPEPAVDMDGGADGAADRHQTYYAEARSWAQDRQAAFDNSRRLAWRVAAVAGAIAALEALALIALAPLKTVVPYTLLVDRNTGFVEALDPAHPLPIKPQTALTQALLAQYVVARETFDINSLPEQYQKVALWSAEAARREYLGLMTRDNPDNPINRYPRTTNVEAQVESVSPLGPDTALVRYFTEQHNAGQGAGPRAFWAAVVRFRFSGEPMALADRLINPLGFQVVSFRRDQEAPPPQPVPMAPMAPAPTTIGPDNTRLPTATIPGSAPLNQPAPAYPHPAGQVVQPGVEPNL